MDQYMDKLTNRMNWIKDLVKAEEQMEESGVVDMSIGIDNEKILASETINFIQNLKNEMIEASNTFNELKASPLGRIKIYGIAKTQADFMLFRNGYKMIFSIKQPGAISIRFNFLGPNQYMPSIPATLPTANMMATPLMEENLITAKRGPFHDLQWTFQEQIIQLPAMIKYHFSLFIKESSK
jgi:hypothetical protein